MQNDKTIPDRAPHRPPATRARGREREGSAPPYLNKAILQTCNRARLSCLSLPPNGATAEI